MDENFGDKVESAISGIANFLKFDKKDREKRKIKEAQQKMKTQDDFNRESRKAGAQQEIINTVQNQTKKEPNKFLDFIERTTKEFESTLGIKEETMPEVGSAAYKKLKANIMDEDCISMRNEPI